VAVDLVVGQYFLANSPIHHLDPRIKVTLLLCYMVLTFLAGSFAALGVLFAFLLGVALLSRVPLPTMLKAMAPLAILLLFPLFFNVFFIATGTPLLHWGPILVTSDGLWRGCFLTLRLLILFWGATLLTLTTSPIELCDATASMLAPFERLGVPAFEISMMVSIALRFIPTLMDDFDHIRKAQLARGATFDSGGPLTRIQAVVPLLVPLFAQSFRHAEDLAYAMESRCYHGGANRTHYHILKVERRDWLAIALMLALLAAVLLLP